MSNGYPKPPSLISHIKSSLLQEWRSWGNLIKSDWPWLAMLAFGIVSLIILTHPFPPKEVFLAVGQKGSTFEMLGQKFIPYFAQEGVRLRLVNTSGSVISLDELADKANPVSAALMTAGVVEKGYYPNLRSLGSIENAPLWFFYRGAEYGGNKPFTYFSEKRVSIGATGSAAHVTLQKILALSGIEIAGRQNLLELSTREASQALIRGDIDGMFIMDGLNSPIIQSLLERPNIHLFNFSYASAYVKKLPYLSVVTIPKGSLDIKKPYPAQDIEMLSSSVALLVEKDMHPALQHIFLVAADKISRDIDQFFSKPEYFPIYVDHAVELSPVAKRFYDGKSLPLRDRVPVWLSSYIDRMWLVLIGLFAIIYPIFKMMPTYRSKYSVMIIEDAYEEIQRIDQLLSMAKTKPEIEALVSRLNELDLEMSESKVSSESMHRLYTLKSALNLVRNQALGRLPN